MPAWGQEGQQRLAQQVEIISLLGVRGWGEESGEVGGGGWGGGDWGGWEGAGSGLVNGSERRARNGKALNLELEKCFKPPLCAPVHEEAEAPCLEFLKTYHFPYKTIRTLFIIFCI